MQPQVHTLPPPPALGASGLCAGAPIPRGASARRQRGVVLFFALIVLVILLIGGIVVVRSINASLFGAGNLAFRRDLTTQSDAAIAPAIQYVSTAKTAGISLTASNPAANYSAIVLPGNAQGIPNALLNDSLFASVGSAGKDISNGGGVTIRYLIERLCKNTGPPSPANCVYGPGAGSSVKGGTAYSASGGPPPRPDTSVVYRLSARVTGPRDTQAFFQTMFSGPS